MSGDILQVVNDATPFIASAAASYGSAVLAQAQDEAANATIRAGRRILLRVFGHREADDPIAGLLDEVAADPSDPDTVGALRRELRNALTEDSQLVADLRAMLGGAAPAVTVGTNEGIISTGAAATNTIHNTR